MASNTALPLGGTSNVPKCSSEHGGGIEHHDNTIPSPPSDFTSKVTSVEPRIREMEDIITSDGQNPSRCRKTPMSEAILHDNTSLRTHVDKVEDLQIPDNKFAFTPSQMTKLVEHKSLSAFYAIQGLDGLERGLRTDRGSGLSSDEEFLEGTISLEEPKAALITGPTSEFTIEPRRKQSGRSPPALPLLIQRSSDSSFADRKEVFGVNKLPEKVPPSFLQLAWRGYKDRVLILLSIAAVISLGVGLYQTFGQPHPKGQPSVEWIEGVTITVAILIVVLVGAMNDWQKERQFAKLNRKKQDRVVKAIRSGKTQEISVFDVLVGDVIYLQPGDVIPADGVLIDGFNVRCDESSATGESSLVKKHAAMSVFKAIYEGEDLNKMDPFILSGSTVSEGLGTFLVTAVGVYSTYGKTMISLHERPQETPLQSKLNRLANQIAKLGTAAAVFMLVTLLIKFLAQLKGNTADASGKAQQFLQVLIVTVAIIVVAVPEGLPLAVTLALAFATTRMLKDNNLVRYLKACETMGNATAICSDKTGTLTQNVMTVVAVCVGQNSNVDDEDGVRLLPIEEFTAAFSVGHSLRSISKPVKILLKDSIAINSTAFESQEKGRLTFIGSKTESALLDFAHSFLGMDSVSLERSKSDVVYLVPFDSGRKYMATVVRTDRGFRIYAKGAAEVMVGKCTRIVRATALDASSSAITPEYMEQLDHAIGDFATRSLRTLALIYRDLDTLPHRGIQTVSELLQTTFDDLFKDMTLLTIVGIQDPLRNGVKDSVARCQKAGITVRMVTGDNILTAKAIAKECGILTEGGLVMDGGSFRKLGVAEMNRVIPHLQVLARSSPEDKKVLVKALQDLGEVVAVTGDGTNDAPALKMADVGFSMGLAGTEVAKEASDIVLMDDNFASIVKAVKWGRTVNDAVRKFLQFQITVNIAAVILTFATAIASDTETSVLTAVQLLWVNLIMDTLGGLALSTDPPAESILDRKPDSRSSPLINITMWKMIVDQSIFKLVVLLILHFMGERIFSYHSAGERAQLRTMVFNTFVWMQIFNEWNNRRIDNKLNIFEGITRNWLFIATNLSMMVGQVLIVLVGGKALQVVRLTGAQWGYSIVLGFLSIPVAVVIRYIPDAAFARIIPPCWRSKITDSTPMAGDESQRDWDSALLEIREEMKFISWIHGGRLHPCGRWRKPGGISELKPVAVMVGLIAGSTGGWPKMGVKFSGRPRLLRTPQNMGAAAARVVARQLP